jgi:N-acyl-L-homoserine lactone synthetase
MFDDKYEVIVADTPAARHIHHRIRYEVYCLEYRFEDPALHPDHEEHDQWDDNAVHFLVRHRASGEWIGAMRLIRPVHGQLPIHEASDMTSAALPNFDGRAWELSRTCILGAYRRRGASPSASGASPASGSTGRAERGPERRDPARPWALPADYRSGPRPTAGNRRLAPTQRWQAPAPEQDGPEHQWRRRVNGFEVLAGMMRAVVEFARARDVHYVYLLTNSALARMAGRLRLDIHRAGAAREHRGMRAPFIAHLNQAVGGAIRRSPEMKRLFLARHEPYRYHSSLESSEAAAFARPLAPEQAASFAHRRTGPFRVAR